MDVEFVQLPLKKEECSIAEKTYWNLRKNRIFFIDFDVDEEYELVELSKTIIEMNVEESNIAEAELKPIQIWIMCFGGDLYQAQFFCDLVEASRIPIVTIATGAAMSAGLLMLLAGKRRYAFKQSEVMIHQGSASFSGTAQEIDAAQESYKKQLQVMRDHILSHTTISPALYKKNEKKDWYVRGEELLKLGIVDKIVDKITDIR